MGNLLNIFLLFIFLLGCGLRTDILAAEVHEVEPNESLNSQFVQKLKEEVELSTKIVQTRNGPLRGIVKNSRDPTKQFVAFMGLRYADKLARFEPAGTFSEKWTEPRIADLPGNVCPQFTENGELAEDEDCLFLNVYVPQGHLEDNESFGKLPVMFYLHGGGFTFGDGTGYGAEYFMENEDVILITIHYRLGVLGWIHTEDSVFPSNNGLRDQIVALRWVQENIEAFKGDPDSITVFGNSAGSASVQYLLMSELSKGLFHKAIMQSGAYSFWSASPNPREIALKFAKHLGCSFSPERNEEQSEQIKKCLEGKSSGELVTEQAKFWPRWPMANQISWFAPTDKESPVNSVFQGKKFNSFFSPGGINSAPMEYPNKVPVMIGNVRDEGSTLYCACTLSEEGALEKLNENWDELAPKTFCYEDYFPADKLPLISSRIREYYFGMQKNLSRENSIHFLTTLYTDTLFLLPVMSAGIEMARDKEMTVFPYVFSYVGRWSLRDAIKVYELPGMIGHADELQYLFPHSFLGPPLEQDSTAEKLSKRLIKLWTSFVKTGVPAASQWTEGLEVDWKPIEISENKLTKRKVEFELLRIDTKLKLINSEFMDRIYFWKGLLQEIVFDSVADQKGQPTPKTEL